MYARTPMGSEHDGRTYATGRRRVEIEWEDHDLVSKTVPDHEINEAIRDVLSRYDVKDETIAHYTERGAWKSR